MKFHGILTKNTFCTWKNIYMYNFVLYINLQVTANLGQLFLCQEDWMKISQAIYLYFILLEWVVVRVYNRSEITAAFWICFPKRFLVFAMKVVSKILFLSTVQFLQRKASAHKDLF